MEHEFHTVIFHGASLLVCKNCSILQTAVTGSEETSCAKRQEMQAIAKIEDDTQPIPQVKRRGAGLSDNAVRAVLEMPSEQIADEIAQLESNIASLKVLLRAARAREKVRSK